LNVIVSVDAETAYRVAENVARSGDGGLCLPNPADGRNDAIVLERLDEIRERLAGISDPVRLLQEIFAYSPFGLQVYRANGHCLLTNKAFRDLFGSEPPPEYNILHDEIAERQGLLGLVTRAFAGETVQTPTFWYDPRELQQVHVTEGRRVSISITLLPLFGGSGAVEHVALVFKDQTEETLAREQLEAALRARQDFLSIAGHELKTPLTSVMLNLHAMDVALQARLNIDDDRVLARWQALGRELRRLDRLVEQLLDISRITAGKMPLIPERVDLGELVREVVDRFWSPSMEPGIIDVKQTGPVEGFWDRWRLDQILTNLLSNAIKYGQGRPISIEFGPVGPEHGSDVSIAVRDRGIGMSPDALGRIFDRFERAVTDREYGGFGLGLWIARQVVQAMDGTITAESEPGRGSTFTVRLPRGARQPAV
jgi:signal transduction histidine kinase